MIPDDMVEEVRAAADIVDVIGEFVQLKKAGREYKANCPFHEERTPSFYVVPAKGFYKCFGCGKSGDVFSFVMERQGLDFVEAVKHVAGRAGVQVREVKRSQEEEDPNRPLYEINGFARDWFRRQLEDATVGAAAREYLEGRGISADVCERYGLGFAPDEWRALRDAAAKHGLEEELMLEVGLLGSSERSREPYDRFRGRIMFTIESRSGRVIAFGGRILEGDTKDAPKYLNSPETPIYHKGSNLYGLSWARHSIRREESALVVEGYMDVVSLAAHGFENVVAPLGTALTPEQAKLLSRYTKRVLLLFDSDAAGLRATFKAGDTLLEVGLHPAVVTLPPGEDPDTLVRSEGREGLEQYLDQAVDVLDRKLQILDEKDYFSSIERTRSAVDRLLPTIRAASDPALRDIYVAKVADRTGVRRETLEAEMKRAASGSAPTSVAAPPSVPRIAAHRVPKLGAERTVLLLMTKNPDFVERAGEHVGAGDFVDVAYRTIFQALLDDPELRAPPVSMDPVAARRLQEILSDPEELAHAGRVFEESVARMHVAALDRRSQDLDLRIAAAAGDGEKRTLIEEKERVSRERRELHPDDWTTTARKLRGDTT
ncbi:MAG TPA: DNA primase [Gemmatimonadetes bacterium]|nr:DNA primase [Gemmatimonadota bacterium]HIN51048.1 DNA primase [Gemmatimonadota bacterium]